MTVTNISKNEFLEKIPAKYEGLIELVKPMKSKYFVRFSPVLLSTRVPDVEIVLSVDLLHENLVFAEEIVMRELCEDIYFTKVNKDEWDKKQKELIDSIQKAGYSVEFTKAGYGDSKYCIFKINLKNFNEENFKKVVDLLEIYNGRARKMFAEYESV